MLPHESLTNSHTVFKTADLGSMTGGGTGLTGSDRGATGLHLLLIIFTLLIIVYKCAVLQAVENGQAKTGLAGLFAMAMRKAWIHALQSGVHALRPTYIFHSKIFILAMLRKHDQISCVRSV